MDIQNLPFFKSKSIVNTTSVSGGSINETYQVETQEKSYFIKLNHLDRFPNMMRAEHKGLDFLRQCDSGFKIPVVVNQDDMDGFQYLILEFIPSGGEGNVIAFAKALHQLHSTSSDYFGLDDDNYIGSLPQPNGRFQSADDYYISSRLEPQFRMAHRNGFRFSDLPRFYQNVGNLIPDLPPAVIHGDLWSGNYMYDPSGQPVLIDPAVSYGIAEMDLAMMKLFSGFDSQIFQEYERLSPQIKGWEKRMPLYQLYYLLVHLNIFGKGYWKQVQQCINSVRRL